MSVAERPVDGKLCGFKVINGTTDFLTLVSTSVGARNHTPVSAAEWQALYDAGWELYGAVHYTLEPGTQRAAFTVKRSRRQPA